MKSGVAIAISLLACISVTSSTRTRFQSVGKNYNINYNSNMNTNLDLNELLNVLFGQQISKNQLGKLTASKPSRFYDHFHASFSSNADEEYDDWYDVDDESLLPSSIAIPKAISSIPIAFPSSSVPSVVPSEFDQIDQTTLMPISDESQLEVLELDPVETPMLNEAEA